MKTLLRVASNTIIPCQGYQRWQMQDGFEHQEKSQGLETLAW